MIIKKIWLMFLIGGASLVLASEPGHSNNYLWKQISGNWQVSEGKKLSDGSKKGHIFGYSDLINNNSIISYKKYKPFDHLHINWKIYSPDSENNAMIFFGTNNYRKYYGFRFYGNKDKITSIAFIKSRVKDTTKRPTAKWNFQLEKIKEKNISLNYNKMFITDIIIKKKTVVLKINNKEVMRTKLPKKLSDSKFGVSHRGNLLKVDRLYASSRNETLLEDDFSSSRIKKRVFRARKVKK